MRKEDVCVDPRCNRNSKHSGPCSETRFEFSQEDWEEIYNCLDGFPCLQELLGPDGEDAEEAAKEFDKSDWLIIYQAIQDKRERVPADGDRTDREWRAHLDAMIAEMEADSDIIAPKPERDSLLRLLDELKAEVERERLGLVDISGPSGMRNSQASALGLARNTVRQEVIDRLTAIAEGKV
jgi:hypothetical protein